MNAVLMTMCVAGSLTAGQGDDVIFRTPQIQVRRTESFGRPRSLPYHQLLYTRIDIGGNFLKPEKCEDHGHPEKDFSRLPTTYYHPHSPVGMALKKFAWFGGPLNTYASDARLPTSLVGMGTNPLSQLVDLWSEPPVAVLGLEAGTPASYARPSQTMHFTERTPTFVKLSLPDAKQPRYFSYVQDALDRGACVKIFDGEPRATIAKHGGEQFYHLMIVECYQEAVHTVHKDLMTKEGMALLMSKLTEEGVICYHTSNRYYNLTRIIASVAEDLKLAHRVGHDMAYRRRDTMGYTSEWIMVARKPEYLLHLKEPEDYKQMVRDQGGRAEPYWSPAPDTQARLVWTDKGENSFRGVYRNDPEIARLSDIVYDFENFLSRRVGLNANRYTRPVHDMIYRWSDASAKMKNRDPAKEMKKK